MIHDEDVWHGILGAPQLAGTISFCSDIFYVSFMGIL